MSTLISWKPEVINNSSWNGLKNVGELQTADDLIEYAEERGIWPSAVSLEPLVCQGITAREKAVVGLYRNEVKRPTILGIHGGHSRVDFNFTAIERRNRLIQAVVDAGGKPTGAFSLAGGRKYVASFQVNGFESGIVTNFLIVDSYDGTCKLGVGTTSLRIFCANQISAARIRDGKDWASSSHSKSLDFNVEVMAKEISQSLEMGQSMREMYEAAKAKLLTAKQYQAAFDALFPEVKQVDEGKRAIGVTRSENIRIAARTVASNVINFEGEHSLATLWNAATYLVDRETDGTAKIHGKADGLDSMIFGARGRKVAEIQSIVERYLEAA